MLARVPPAILTTIGRAFDALERRWQLPRVQRGLGVVLVIAFLGDLLLIELSRRGMLPASQRFAVPTNHFAAVALAFTLLLLFETLALVFSLVHSIAEAVGKQFELLSLILLRKAFLAFAQFGEPVQWSYVEGAIRGVLADMLGALVVFVITGIYYRVQHHKPITADHTDQASFIAAKKVVALALLGAFVFLGLSMMRRAGGPPSVHHFFEVFYTILIFSDVLLVLVSLAYSDSYHLVFRNSGFAAATLIVRLALNAPAYVNVLLGVAAAGFGLAVSVAYNAYAPLQHDHENA